MISKVGYWGNVWWKQVNVSDETSAVEKRKTVW